MRVRESLVQLSIVVALSVSCRPTSIKYIAYGDDDVGDFGNGCSDGGCVLAH